MILMLTELAKDYKKSDCGVVSAIECIIYETPADRKLLYLYLIDCICKNVRLQYITLFSQCLVSLSCHVYTSGSSKVKHAIVELRKTWYKLFSNRLLIELDEKMREIDQNWPFNHRTRSTGQTGVVRDPVDLSKENRFENKLPSVQPLFKIDQHLPAEILSYSTTFSTRPVPAHTISVSRAVPLNQPTIGQQTIGTQPALSYRHLNPINQQAICSQPGPFTGHLGPHSPINPFNQLVSQYRTAACPPPTFNSQPHNSIRPAFANPPFTYNQSVPYSSLHSSPCFPPCQTERDFKPVNNRFGSTGFRAKHRDNKAPNKFNRKRRLDSSTSPVKRRHNQSPERKHPEPNIPELELNPESMRVKRDYLIKQLYRGLQCTSCSLRFDVQSKEGKEKYSTHLDWHFRKNRRNRNKTVNLRRDWYYPLDQWLQFKEITLESNSSKPDKQPTADRKQLEPCRSQSNVQPRIKSNPDNSLNVCSMCLEKFEEIWCDEEECWLLENAALIDSHYYHQTCLIDQPVSTSESTDEQPTDLDLSESSKEEGEQADASDSIVHNLVNSSFRIPVLA